MTAKIPMVDLEQQTQALWPELERAVLGVLRDARGSFTVGVLALAGMALVGFAAVVALWRTGSAREHRLTS